MATRKKTAGTSPAPAPRKQAIQGPATALGDFEGSEVAASKVAITNAGDGLSKAVAVEPRPFHKGDRVYVVLQTVCGPIKFDPIAGGTQVVRVHTLKTELATIVDEAVVRELLDAQRAAIDAAKGQPQLGFDPADDAEIAIDPETGEPVE